MKIIAFIVVIGLTVVYSCGGPQEDILVRGSLSDPRNTPQNHVAVQLHDIDVDSVIFLPISRFPTDYHTFLGIDLVVPRHDSKMMYKDALVKGPTKNLD